MRKQLGLAHASTAEWRVFCRGAGLARFTALLQHTYGVHEQYNNCIYTFMGSLISPLTSPHRASIDRQWVSCESIMHAGHPLLLNQRIFHVQAHQIQYFLLLNEAVCDR